MFHTYRMSLKCARRFWENDCVMQRFEARRLNLFRRGAL
ncbi:hypothetical protein MPLB_70002 [Mesorhizobium sp. ORS 3324]|nr:hypothetical protein MPLB_70002 [Mesorhizobium sp. ORS 3324]